MKKEQKGQMIVKNVQEVDMPLHLVQMNVTTVRLVRTVILQA